MTDKQLSITRIPLTLMLGFISLLGCMPILHGLLGLVRKYYYPKFSERILYYMEPFFFPEKRLELFCYLSFCIIGACHIGILILCKNLEAETYWWKSIRISEKQTWGVLTIAVLINSFCWLINAKFLALLWLLPIIMAYFPLLTAINAYLSRKKWPVYAILTFSLITFFTIISPFIFSTPRISSEYLNIEGTTLVPDDHNAQENVEIDNHKFINSNRKFGFLKYDYRRPISENQLSTVYPSAVVHPTEALIEIIKQESYCISSNIVQKFQDTATQTDAMKLFENFSGQRIAYDPVSSRLYALQPIDEPFARTLESCVQESDQVKIKTLCAMSRSDQTDISRAYYNNEEKNFILSNKMELTNQMLSRRMIHHHNFLLGPINELDKGRSESDINMQYGFLFVLAAQKFLRWLFDDITFSQYFHLLFTFFPVYLLSGIIIFWMLTRDIRYTTIFSCISIGTLAAMGYFAVSIAPGVNPIRHIFDLSTLYLLHIRFRQSSQLKQFTCDLAIYALCLLSAINNDQTGLALSAAVLFVLCLEHFNTGRGFTRIPAFHMFAALAIVALWHYWDKGNSSLTPYYLLGLCGFPAQEQFYLPFVICSITVIASIVLCWNHMASARRSVILAGSLYSIGVFIYYIWGGTRHHFLNYLSIYMFTFLISFKWLSECISEIRGKQPHQFWGIALLAGTAYLILGIALFYNEKNTFDQDFSSHKTYTWGSPKAKILSTMPETPFLLSQDLIRKTASESGIYIISQYDNFIPFLSGHYSAMPYPDLQWFINSEKEKRQCIRAINDAKPKWLFTDRDIERDLSFEVIDPSVPIFGELNLESVMRVHRLRGLQALFNEVKNDYIFKESAGLLSVWTRKN